MTNKFKKKAGRPRLPKELVRPNVNTKVSQETLSWLDSQPEGRGKAIDKLVEKAKLREGFDND